MSLVLLKDVNKNVPKYPNTHSEQKEFFKYANELVIN